MEGHVKKQKREVGIDRLREMLAYDHESGRLTWLIARPRGVRPGDTFGCVNAIGYRVGCVDGVQLFAHRVAWALHHGSWPSSFLDHKNRKRDDNRLCNLRLCGQSQNVMNTDVDRRNKSGVKGVCWNAKSGKWQAGIKCKGRSIHLGLFGDIGEAARVRAAAAKSLFGEFAGVA